MLNRCVLIGRLAKDPELRYTQSNKAVCMFPLAVDSGFGDTKKTDFFDIVVWGKAGENCANYTSKGKLIAVDGRISTRAYEAKDGRKVKVYEIVAEAVRFLSPKTAEDGRSAPAFESPPIIDSEDLPF